VKGGDVKAGRRLYFSNFYYGSSHTKKFMKMKKIFFVLAAVITGNQLLSQDTTNQLLDEAVVTANKFSSKTSLTGKVVTIITSEQLQKSGGRDLSQILAEQSSIYISGANSNPGKDKNIYLRGAGPDRCLITIDGIPVYDPSGIGSNFDIRNIAIGNIERIEIVKGSQSTLYGSDAIAGVINIITKKNTNKTAEGNVMSSYGSNETFRAQASINGRSGNVDYNAGYSFHHTNGINETVNNNPNAFADRDKFKQQSFQSGFGVRTGKNIYIQPFLRYTDLKGDFDQGAFVDELDETYHQQSWQAGVRNEVSIGKSKLVVLYQYNSIDRLYIDDSVKSRNGFDIYSRGKYAGNEHFADAYIIVPFTNTIKLTGGIDFRSSRSDQEYFSVGYYGPFNTIYSADSLHQDQTGIYAALNWNDKSGFNLEAGGRVNIHSTYGSYFVFNINPSYLINKKWKVFANLSSAYRTPSLYQLFSEYGNRDLKPESAITTEGGIQYYAPDNKFTGRVVVFNRNVKDGIFFYFNSTTFVSQYINQDKQKDHGFEAEADYRIAKGTRLKLFYTYVNGEITTRKGNKDTTYFNLIRRPKSSLGINLSCQATKKLFISSNLQYASKRQDSYFDNNTFTIVNVTLSSYALWDIYLDYAIYKNRLRIFADLRNVTNVKYTEIAGFNSLGFNGYGGLRVNF